MLYTYIATRQSWDHPKLCASWVELTAGKMLKVVASCAVVLTVRSANDIATVKYRYSIVYV